MSDVWDQLAPEPPRDRWGRYLITPADGGKAVAHTRATTVAKTLSDQGGLIGWKQRMTALGLAARPDLLLGVQSADPEDRKTLGRLVDDAAEAGGASSKATIGTALHRFVEAVNLGQTPDVPAEYRSTIDAYRQALTAHGIEVVPGLVERIVVLPAGEPIAGTFDLAVTDTTGPPMIADLKTGASVRYGVGEWAVQLAIYAHAETMWDPRTDTHTPMPEVNRERAVIFHAPAGEGRCDVYVLDIARGWEQLQTCLAVRQWRKAKGLLVPAADVIPSVPVEAPTTPDGGGDLGGPASHADAIIDERVTYLRGRLAALAEHQPDAIDRVRGAWPTGCPTLPEHVAGTARLTVEQLDAIEQIVTGAETVTEAPFGSDRDPAGPLPPKDPRVADLSSRFAALPSDLRALVADDFTHHGIPKLSSGQATVAHLDTATSLIVGAEAAHDERRSAAWSHINSTPSPVNLLPTDLTAAAVQELADTADAYAAGWLGDDLQPVANVGDLMLERFGNRRGALDAARLIGHEIGVPAPRAFDALTTCTPLVARLAVTDGPE